VARQDDMELTGIVDVTPTLSIRALYDSETPYDLYVVDDSMAESFEKENIPVKGNFDNLLSKVDIVLDAAPAGIGKKTKSSTRKRI
jgi:glyceraldehyde-3-phosphate dehydrogenase (NAD(P))